MQYNLQPASLHIDSITATRAVRARNHRARSHGECARRCWPAPTRARPAWQPNSGRPMRSEASGMTLRPARRRRAPRRAAQGDAKANAKARTPRRTPTQSQREGRRGGHRAPRGARHADLHRHRPHHRRLGELRRLLDPTQLRGGHPDVERQHRRALVRPEARARR